MIRARRCATRAGAGYRRWPEIGRIIKVAPVILAALTACQDATAPLEPQFGVQPLKGVWLVTSLDDPGAGGCTSSYCTLRQAIAAAEPRDRIEFKGNLSGTIALTAGELLIDKDLVIEGAARITIDAQRASRVFRINGPATVWLDGLHLTGGFAPDGGGILNTAVLHLNSMDVVANEAEADGGGIYTSGRLFLSSSNVSANEAGDEGGGLYLGASAEIRRSTVADNGALGGAGIYNGAFTTIAVSTFSGNFASEGGAVLNEGDLTIRTTTIAKNSSLRSAGGIHNLDRSRVSVLNTIVAENAGHESGRDCLDVDDGGLNTITSFGYNLTTPDGGCPFAEATDVLVPRALVFTLVLESNLQPNGGVTPTYMPLERGLAVDAGYCPGETRDQRGYVRPYDDTRMPNALDGCDIGAVEWQPPPASGPGNGPKK